MKSFVLGSLVMFAFAAPAVGEDACVEVEIGGEKTANLNCLNQSLQGQVNRVHPLENIAPLDGSSQEVQLGGYNQGALKQQYGANYGKSAVPWRPTSDYRSSPR